MTIQLALGIMNPLVMLVVAIIIAAEKLMPNPDPIVRISGVAIMTTGAAVIGRSLS